MLSYIHSLFIHLDSLEVIRLINNQPCPYFQCFPIENRGSRVDDIMVDSRFPGQRTYKDIGIFSKYLGQGSQRPMFQNQENRQDTLDEKVRNYDKNQDTINRLVLQFGENSLINE